MKTSSVRFRTVCLEAPRERLPELAAFYSDLFGDRCRFSDGERLGLAVGETMLELVGASGLPFYHVALLAPGDRFDAASAWAGSHVELVPDPETGETTFDFVDWDAQACYLHDPAGNIVELIAHRGVAETGATGRFEAGELIGVSEVGLVCDPPALARDLDHALGLTVWDGTVEGEGRLAFVGERARTLILCRAGRGWLPTGRAAEEHRVEVVIAGSPPREVSLGEGRGSVRRDPG